MDPYRLLSRSTKLSKSGISRKSHSTPSSGQQARPQPLAGNDVIDRTPPTVSKKRKRGQDPTNGFSELDFFGAPTTKSQPKSKSAVEDGTTRARGVTDGEAADPTAQYTVQLSLDEARDILKKHKLKATWLNPPTLPRKAHRKGKDKTRSSDDNAKNSSLYPQPFQSFMELRTRYGISSSLVSNIEEQGFSVPTEVQLAGLPLLLDKPESFLTSLETLPDTSYSASKIDLLTVAPTGSGKTLAFMIPLIHQIRRSRQDIKDAEKKTFAIILAPTKELAGQIVNEGRKLSQNTGIRITQVRKGMRLVSNMEVLENEADESDAKSETVVKSDILVSTPGILSSTILQAQEHDESALSAVQQLVLDEADVLLDPLFREQTLAIWNALQQPSLRVSLWSATMGSNIEELARSIIEQRRSRLSGKLGQDLEANPLIRLVVGLKDSALPNVQHKLVYAASEQGKLMGLRQLLHPAATSNEAGPPLLPPFLVFTQTIERAVALHSELLYDIPAEAGGISRIAVLHSDLSDAVRDSVMTRFRKGEIWVLITTDLLSRGVDFRGVNGVVNYDIPTSSAAYVHRVGRTGRAGREGGVAVTLYSREDIPYLKPIANLVAAAQKLKGSSGGAEIQPWLLDSLPSLSKKGRQDLKRRGVESRTARGREKDPKAARKARISTKAGFLRQEENKRKGAVLGSQKRQEIPLANDDEDGSDFGGFD